MSREELLKALAEKLPKELDPQFRPATPPSAGYTIYGQASVNWRVYNDPRDDSNFIRVTLALDGTCDDGAACFDLLSHIRSLDFQWAIKSLDYGYCMEVFEPSYQMDFHAATLAETIAKAALWCVEYRARDNKEAP